MYVVSISVFICSFLLRTGPAHGIERPTGGERGKGGGRRNANQNQRGQFGRVAGSPFASPMSGYGVSNDGHGALDELIHTSIKFYMNGVITS